MKPGRNDPCPCASGKKYKACCGTAGRQNAIDSQHLLSLFHGGHFAALENQIEHLLRQGPQTGFLWSLLGAALQMQGKNGLAALRKATALAPNDAEAHCNLGTALHNEGQTGNAEACYRKVLALNPAHLRAHLNLASLLGLSGRLPEAEASFRQAMSLQPGRVDALTGLGDVLTRLNRLDEAEACLRQAASCGPGPGHAEALLCLGNLQFKRGLSADARSSFLSALEINPGFARAHNNLGNVLLEHGDIDKAIDCFRRALEIEPSYAEAHSNLGIAYVQMNRFTDAEASYRSALQLQPERSELHGQLGFVFKELGRIEDARKAYATWSERDPEAVLPRLALTLLDLPVAPRDKEKAGQVPEQFEKSLKALSRWIDSDPARSNRFGLAMGSQQPFHLAYRSGNLAGPLSRYGRLAARCVHFEVPPAAPREKLRLLVVSGHVRRHSVWDVVLHGLLANLDRKRFEVFLYHTGAQEDAETALARTMVDAWRDRKNHPDFDMLRDAIANDHADVIFYPEIGMDPFTFRLAAHRLAPLQVAGWGHPVTTGLPTIDLYLSGALLEPQDADDHYCEQLIRLPGTGCCTTQLDIPVEPIEDIDALLRQRPGPRFVIAQRAFKADPSHDVVYAEIAATTGPCTFILLQDPIYPWATATVLDRLKTAFRAQGLDPEQYFLEIPWLSSGQFPSLLEACDVFLDCPSFSGYTTAWQALHCGLPMVTLEGDFLRQRLAAGLLRKIGADDMIAGSLEEYVCIATRLAGEAADPVQRQHRREMIRTAAPRADNDLDVVRAFERTLLSELSRRRNSRT